MHSTGRNYLYFCTFVSDTAILVHSEVAPQRRSCEEISLNLNTSLPSLQALKFGRDIIQVHYKHKFTTTIVSSETKFLQSNVVKNPRLSNYLDQCKNLVSVLLDYLQILPHYIGGNFISNKSKTRNYVILKQRSLKLCLRFDT